MTSPVAAGQRFIGAGPFFWMADIAKVLRTRLKPPVRRAPSWEMPTWLVRLAANFDPVVKERLFELDKSRPVSADKARTQLGWAPRSNETMIIDTAQSLYAQGVLTR